MYTVKEAAQVLQRSPQRVRAYVREKDPDAKYNLKTAKKTKGKWLIEESEVHQLLEERRQRKQHRRRQRKIKALTKRAEHIKYVLRMVQLDSTMDRSHRGHFLAFLHEKIEESQRKLAKTRRAL